MTKTERQAGSTTPAAGLTRHPIGAGIIESSVQLTIVQSCNWNRWAGFFLVVVLVLAIKSRAGFTAIGMGLILHRERPHIQIEAIGG